MKDMTMTGNYEVISPTRDCLEPKTDYLELLLYNYCIIRYSYYSSQSMNHEINSIIIQKYILKNVLTSRCV